MTPDLLRELNRRRRAREPVAVLATLATGAETILGPAELMALERDDPATASAVRAAFRSGRSALIAGDRFLTVYPPPLRIVAVGAVHISQAMVPLARALGLSQVVVDPREGFASPERFPGVALHALWPDEAADVMALDPGTAFCALTHDPKIDDPALAMALAAGCFYVGALGSRKTHASRLARLEARGFDAATLGRIRAPIGLAIGAVSPAEIAVAIMAEIIRDLRASPEGEG